MNLNTLLWGVSFLASFLLCAFICWVYDALTTQWQKKEWTLRIRIEETSAQIATLSAKVERLDGIQAALLDALRVHVVWQESRYHATQDPRPVERPRKTT